MHELLTVAAPMWPTYMLANAQLGAAQLSLALHRSAAVTGCPGLRAAAVISSAVAPRHAVRICSDTVVICYTEHRPFEEPTPC
jgi:hypothetical protein